MAKPNAQQDQQDSGERKAGEALLALLLAWMLRLEKSKTKTSRAAVIALADLRAKLAIDLGRSKIFDASKITTQLSRLGDFKKLFRESVRETYAGMYRGLRDNLRDIATTQSESVLSSINKTAGGELAGNALESSEITAVLDDLHVQGAPLKTWLERQAGTVAQRVEDSVRGGILNEDDASKIITKIAGETEAGSLGSGTLKQAEVALAALVRTAAQQAANDAKMKTIQANSDVISGFQWVAILDNRTTPLCRRLNGLVWDLEYNPVGHDKAYPGDPPIHWNCRSSVVPVLRKWSEM